MSRRALAGALLVAAAVSFAPAPASAVCYYELSELTGWCSYCDPLGIPYNAAQSVLGDKLPPLECAA